MLYTMDDVHFQVEHRSRVKKRIIKHTLMFTKSVFKQFIILSF